MCGSEDLRALGYLVMPSRFLLGKIGLDRYWYLSSALALIEVQRCNNRYRGSWNVAYKESYSSTSSLMVYMHEQESATRYSLIHSRKQRNLSIPTQTKRPFYPTTTKSPLYPVQ